MGGRLTVHLAGEDGGSTGEVEIADTRDLAAAQAEALGRIADRYAATVAAGVVVTVAGQAKAYQIDDTARINIACAALDAAAVLQGTPGAVWPNGFYWIAADNTEQPMSAVDCFVWTQTIKSYWAKVIYANRTLKNQVLTLTTREACDAFDATVGWPPNR